MYVFIYVLCILIHDVLIFGEMLFYDKLYLYSYISRYYNKTYLKGH